MELSPDRRFDLAERVSDGDRVLLAAAQLRETEREAMPLQYSVSLDSPYLHDYNLWHAGPRLAALNKRMKNLKGWYQLQTGDQAKQGLFGQVVKFDPDRVVLDVQDWEANPRVGELVVITSSAIREFKNNQSQPIFNAQGRLLRNKPKVKSSVT